MPSIHVPAYELQRAFDAVNMSGFLSGGRYTKQFEHEVSRWCGLESVAVANCGMGLFAILRTLPKPVARRAVAVVSANTFFATGAMAREAGYEVVLADCSKRDFCLSVESLERYAPPDTAVVILTHVGGGLAKEYAEIAAWCHRRGVLLVEDAAHALGCGGDVHGGLTAGALGHAAAFSCYATKPMCIGEGGVVVSRSPVVVSEVERFCNYGKATGAGGEIYYSGVGFNARMSEWTAAVGYLQMKRRKPMMERRARAADHLRKMVTPMVGWDASTWYKFIVPAGIIAKRYTGQVYAASDQLTDSMRLPGSFPNAEWVAANHKCLPIEEGLYAGQKEL